MITFLAAAIITAILFVINPFLGLTFVLLFSVATFIVGIGHLRKANKFIEEEKRQTLDNQEKRD